MQNKTYTMKQNEIIHSVVNSPETSKEIKECFRLWREFADSAVLMLAASASRGGQTNINDFCEIVSQDIKNRCSDFLDTFISLQTKH